jgi:hypothetical protein
MSRFESLDSLIRESLIALAEWLNRRNEWHGREREVISLYAFRFLVPRCRKGSALHHRNQIGIEVAVPQLQTPGKRRKTYVCKDLVLWEEPYWTYWDAVKKEERYPMAIMEWKTGKTQNSTDDEEWLRRYSRKRKNFSGYSVSINLKEPKNHSLFLWREMEKLNIGSFISLIETSRDLYNRVLLARGLQSVRLLCQ